MTCPQCGSPSLSDQKFCRSCGMHLHLTTQQLVTPANVHDLGSKSAVAVKERRSRNNLVLSGFVMMFIGAAIGVVGKKLLYQDIITVVGVLISLAGMFLTCYRYLSPTRRSEDEPTTSSQPQAQIGPSATEYLVSGDSVEYVPSVTERTTNLLTESGARRPPNVKSSSEEAEQP